MTSDLLEGKLYTGIMTACCFLAALLCFCYILKILDRKNIAVKMSWKCAKFVIILNVLFLLLFYDFYNYHDYYL